MKKLGLIIIFLLIGFIFCSIGIRADNSSISAEQIKQASEDLKNSGSEAINNAISQPEIQSFVDEANKYIGPISKFLFGIELEFSWIFFFSLFLWIILVVIVNNVIGEVLSYNKWLAFLGALVIATLAMNTYGDNFAVWISTFATSWLSAGLAIATGLVFLVIYSIFSKLVLLRGSHKERMEKASQKGKILNISAKVEKERLEAEAED